MENVTREVIADLWPIYSAGEASADTRALVDAFLREDPGFAQTLKEADLRITIPTAPGTESLNVAATAAICLYEAFSHSSRS